MEAKSAKANNSNDKNVAKSPPDLSHVPCKFYRQGACQAGKSCPFSHNLEPSSSEIQCKYFQKGNCKFGSKCMLAHILPDGRRVSSRNGYSNSSQSQRNGQNDRTHRKSQADPSSSLNESGVDGKQRKGSSMSNNFARNGSINESDGRSFEDDNSDVSRDRRTSQHVGSVPADYRSRSRVTVEDVQSSISSLSVNSTQRNLLVPARQPTISASIPANMGKFWGSNGPEYEDVFDEFTFEEDFLPSSLQDLLTPFERHRKSLAADDWTSSMENKFGESSSPSQSKFGALFERHKREELLSSSPLRKPLSNSAFGESKGDAFRREPPMRVNDQSPVKSDKNGFNHTDDEPTVFSFD